MLSLYNEQNILHLMAWFCLVLVIGNKVYSGCSISMVWVHIPALPVAYYGQVTYLIGVFVAHL